MISYFSKEQICEQCGTAFNKSKFDEASKSKEKVSIYKCHKCGTEYKRTLIIVWTLLFIILNMVTIFAPELYEKSIFVMFAVALIVGAILRGFRQYLGLFRRAK